MAKQDEPFENDPDVAQTIEKAEHCINLSVRDSLTKGQLLEIDRKLSGYYTYLEVKAARYQRAMNTDYWHRSIKYSKQAIKERAVKMAQNKLDHHAKVEVAEEIEQQNFSAFQYEYLNRLCLGIAKVINSVKNRLEWLKIEYQYQRNQT